VKQKRKEFVELKSIEKEVKKVRVMEIMAREDDPAVKRVKIDIAAKKAIDGVTIRT